MDVSVRELTLEVEITGAELTTTILGVDSSKGNPSQYITIRSTTTEAEVKAIAADFIARNRHDASYTPTLVREIQAAVTRACQSELGLLEEASNKMSKRFEDLAVQVGESEEARLHHQNQADQTSKKLQSAAAQAKKKTSMLSEFEEIDAKVALLQSKGCTTSSKLAKMLAELQTQLEAKKNEIKALDPTGRGSMEAQEDDFSTVDADGDGVISPEEMTVWSRKKTEILRRANAQRQQLIRENSRLRVALSGSLAGGAEGIETTLRKKDQETAELADQLSGTRLANQNIEHEMTVIARDMQDLKEEVSRIEDQGTSNGGGSDQTARARERAQVLKNWSDEKEGVLTIHERARQEWELEKEDLVLQIDNLRATIRP